MLLGSESSSSPQTSQQLLCREKGKPSIDTVKKGNIRSRYFVLLFFCLKSIWLGKLRNPGQFLGGSKSCLSSVVFVGLLHLQPEGAVRGRTLTHTLVTLLPSRLSPEFPKAAWMVLG